MTRDRLLASVLLLLLTGCAGIQAIDDEATLRGLPVLAAPVGRSVIAAKLGERWIYRDHSRRIVVYPMRVDNFGRPLVVKTRDEGDHELVLVFDDMDRLTHYRLLRVR